MYNPLIEIKHTDNTSTFIRALDVIRIQNWGEKKVFYKEENSESYYKAVKNIDEVIKILNEVENRNELSSLLH